MPTFLLPPALAVVTLAIGAVQSAALGLAMAVAQTPVTSVEDRPAGDFAVVLIGTGIPLPNPARGTAATLIVAGEQQVLVDAGRSAVVGLAQAGHRDVSLVLFTHYHSDHIAGLGELLAGRAIAGATTPLNVIGPPGVKRVVAGFRDAYALDAGYRRAHHGEHWSEAGAAADVSEATPGVVFRGDGLVVTMFAVDHDPVIPAVGYRFDYRGRSVVVSGDTKKVALMVEMARGVDLLVHEAVDRERVEQARVALRQLDPRRHAMAGDMLAHHTSTLEVAEIARDAGVKRLVLTHLVPSIPPVDAAERDFVRGMAAIYNGPILVGRDGMRVVVE